MNPAAIKIGGWILGLLLLWLARHRQRRAVRPLFSPRGPRTDTALMKRHELMRSGIWFLAVGLLFLSAGVFVAVVRGGDFVESAPLLYVMFILVFLGLMGLGGGIYLLYRGFIQSPAPPELGDRAPITPR